MTALDALDAVLAFFAGSWPLWAVPLTVAAYLLVRRPAPDAPNYDAEAYPDGLPDWAWVDDALALGNGDDFRDWEDELRGGVR